MVESSNTASERSTTRLSEGASSAQSAVPPFYTGQSSAAWQVTLLVQDERSVPLRLSVGQRAVIGRPDEVEGFMPEIDTTPFHGRDKGVSRRHAEFITLEGQLHVRDLGSTNGTRLNGQLLQPNRAYRLREGNLLQFGNLYMLIKLNETAQQASQ
jgi:pSer/pThr/pTyr-binding forkhead associated (FHA) protein